jgi:hypothetical protein
LGTVSKLIQQPKIICSKHVKELLHLSEVNNNTATEYRSLINQVCCNLSALEALNLETPVHELMLIELMLSKLKPADRHQWESHIVNVKSPRLNHLIEFLENKCQTIETIEFRNSNSTCTSKQWSKVDVKSGHNNARKSFVVNEASSRRCFYCDGNHVMFSCREFKELKCQ